MFLAIDPGADAGWALFDDRNALAACGMGMPLARHGVTRVLIERPMIYPGRKQQARPRDVITLALRAGEVGGACRLWAGVSEVTYVEPSTWKGQVPKDIHHARIWAKLVPLEQEIASQAGKGIAPSKRHNMLDAIGLGLYGVGR